MLLAAQAAFRRAVRFVARWPNLLRSDADGLGDQAFHLRPGELDGHLRGSSRVMVLARDPVVTGAAVVQAVGDVMRGPVTDWFFWVASVQHDKQKRNYYRTTCQHCGLLVPT